MVVWLVDTRAMGMHVYCISCDVSVCWLVIVNFLLDIRADGAFEVGQWHTDTFSPH